MQLVRNNNIALLEMKTMVGSAVTICPLNHVLDAAHVFKRLFIDCLCESQAQTTLTLTTFWASGSWLKANTTLVYPLPAHPWQNHYELCRFWKCISHIFQAVFLRYCHHIYVCPWFYLCFFNNLLSLSFTRDKIRWKQIGNTKIIKVTWKLSVYQNNNDNNESWTCIRNIARIANAVQCHN